MKTLIRITWFFVSMLIYNPVMKGLDSIDAGFIVKSIVALAIFFFIFYIPSNALIAMFAKSPKQRATNLSAFLWKETKSFASRINKTYYDEFFASYICAAFYYTVLADVQYYQMEEEMRKHLLDSGISALSSHSSSHPRIMRDTIDWVMIESLQKFQDSGINPFLEGGPTELYKSTIQLYDPDEEFNANDFVEFTASLVKISDYSSRLFK